MRMPQTPNPWYKTDSLAQDPEPEYVHVDGKDGCLPGLVGLIVVLALLMAMCPGSVAAAGPYQGGAHWYGPAYANRVMADGRQYDPAALTVANRPPARSAWTNSRTRSPRRERRSKCSQEDSMGRKS
jgi:hypothetical protein